MLISRLLCRFIASLAEVVLGSESVCVCVCFSFSSPLPPQTQIGPSGVCVCLCVVQGDVFPYLTKLLDAVK